MGIPTLQGHLLLFSCYLHFMDFFPIDYWLKDSWDICAFLHSLKKKAVSKISQEFPVKPYLAEFVLQQMLRLIRLPYCYYFMPLERIYSSHLESITHAFLSLRQVVVYTSKIIAVIYSYNYFKPSTVLPSSLVFEQIWILLTHNLLPPPFLLLLSFWTHSILQLLHSYHESHSTRIDLYLLNCICLPVLRVQAHPVYLLYSEHFARKSLNFISQFFPPSNLIYRYTLTSFYHG